MAVVRITCGECGAGVSSRDIRCPRCGAAFEIPGIEATSSGAEGLACKACGQRNHNPGRFCESCGAELQGGAQLLEKPGRESAASKGRRKGPRKANSSRVKLSGFHLPVALIILALGAWFVYDETTRETPPLSGPSRLPGAESSPAEVREIEQLQQTVDANPQDSEALLRLANLLQDHSAGDRGLLPRAIDAYKRYLVLNPGSENPRVDLGICYFEISKIDSLHAGRFFQLALQEMQSVYKANPKHQAAAYNLGIVSLSSGRTTESGEWFRRAMEINPDSDLGQRSKRLLEQHEFEGTIQ